MTANVSSPYADAAPARHTGLRVVVGLLGLAALVIGIVLLFNPVAAARTWRSCWVSPSSSGGCSRSPSAGTPRSGAWASFVLGAVLVIGGSSRPRGRASRSSRSR